MSEQTDRETAVITGASSGIGACIALALAREGMQTLLVGRDPARLAEAAAACSPHAPSATVSVDVTDDGAPSAIAAAAHEAFGTVDVVVHCAGLYLRAPMEDAPVADLDRQWAVNVRAPYAITRELLPDLDGGGRVVLVTSGAGRVGLSHRVGYCATKGAAEMLMHAMAVELAPRGIRVNSVAPGFIETPMNAHLRTDPEFVRQIEAITPAGRFGTAEEVASVACFLATRASGFVTGETIGVTGGYPSAPLVSPSR